MRNCKCNFIFQSSRYIRRILSAVLVYVYIFVTFYITYIIYYSAECDQIVQSENPTLCGFRGFLINSGYFQYISPPRNDPQMSLKIPILGINPRPYIVTLIQIASFKSELVLPSLNGGALFEQERFKQCIISLSGKVYDSAKLHNAT